MEIPDLGQKMFAYLIGDMTRFSDKKENQSISVINNFFNGKKLDYYILKGENNDVYAWINIFLHRSILQTYPKMAL